MSLELISIHVLPVPIHLQVGDALIVTHTDKSGTKTKLNAFEFSSSVKIDAAAIFKVKDALGFKSGIAAVMGEAE